MARTTTVEVGWNAPDDTDCRLVLEVGDGVEVTEILEEGTETLRPDLLDAATAALSSRALQARIDHELMQAEPDCDPRYDTREEYEGLR